MAFPTKSVASDIWGDHTLRSHEQRLATVAAALGLVISPAVESCKGADLLPWSTALSHCADAEVLVRVRTLLVISTVSLNMVSGWLTVQGDYVRCKLWALSHSAIIMLGITGHGGMVAQDMRAYGSTATGWQARTD